MGRFAGFDEVYAALYVDFDNIYSRLREQDEDVARAFATNPQRWVKWLELHALRMLYGDGVKRRILKRICYMNPQCFHEFRPYFIRTAFQVVDCPPLTQQGKTSADIHLVMDCMDALNHATRFDEFIILSGDADFTPLLLRLQEHARRTLVLSVGYTSPAYTAAAAWRIREDWFVLQALMDEVLPEMPQTPVGGAQVSGPAAAGPAVPDTELLRRVTEVVRRAVADSPGPLGFATLAQTLQKELDPGADWYGYGRLRDLLEALDLSGIESSPVPPGYLYDPERHQQPAERDAHEEFRSRYPDLFDFALKVHRLTDMPMLQPDHFRQMLEIIVEEVNSNGFFLTTTSRNVRDRCVEAGLPIARGHVNFVLIGIGRGGYPLNEQKGVSLREVGKSFLRNAYDLCRMSQLNLEKAEHEMLLKWILPKESQGD